MRKPYTDLQRIEDMVHGITPEKRKQIDHDVGVAQFFFGLFCFLVFLAHIL